MILAIKPIRTLIDKKSSKKKIPSNLIRHTPDQDPVDNDNGKGKLGSEAEQRKAHVHWKRTRRPPDDHFTAAGC